MTSHRRTAAQLVEAAFDTYAADDRVRMAALDAAYDALDSFLAADAVTKARLWAGYDLLTKRSLVSLQANRTGKVIDTGAAVAHYDEKYAAVLAAAEAEAALGEPDAVFIQITAKALAVAADEAGDARARNALNRAAADYALGSRPIRAGDGWLVPSSSGERPHRVEPDRGCDCEAARNGRACRHDALVEVVEVATARWQALHAPRAIGRRLAVARAKLVA
jgi:hypothetical protein